MKRSIVRAEDDDQRFKFGIVQQRRERVLNNRAATVRKLLLGLAGIHAGAPAGSRDHSPQHYRETSR